MAAITQSFLDQIESYDSCLGSGAFGIVIKVTASNKKESAIKILFPDNVEPKEQKRMLREVLTVGFERNDNIVQIVNFESKTFTQEELKVIFQVLPHNLEDYKQLYLSRAKRLGGVESLCVQMELCGENLKTWLDKDKDKIDPSIEQLQAVIPKNLIDGLKFLHDHKIIHRDLKPANILFSSSNFCLPVKIGDFGMCRNVHSETSLTDSLTSNVGTYNYMAPEVRAGKYSYQADLYSLGLIIWEVVQLIEASKKTTLFYQLLDEQMDDVVQESKILTGVRKLIIDLTKRSVRQRMQSMDDVLAVSSHWEMQSTFSNETITQFKNSLQVTDSKTNKIKRKDYPSMSPKPKRQISNLPTQWKQRVEDGNTLSNANEFQTIPSSILFEKDNQINAPPTSMNAVCSKAKLPFAIFNQAVLYDGADSIYVMGGFGSLCGFTSNILVYQISTDTITKVGSLPSPSRGTSAHWGDKEFRNIFYLCGGPSGNEVYKFDTQTKTASKVGSLPYNIQGETSFKANDNSNLVYILGINDQENVLLSYDLDTLISSVVTTLPFSGASSVLVGNRAFIYGQRNAVGKETLLELNLDTFTMTPVGDLEYPKIELGSRSVSDGNRFVYLFGGYATNNSIFHTNGITQFDIVTLKSRFFPISNFPVKETEYYYEACVYVKKLNRIYCFGGRAMGPIARPLLPIFTHSMGKEWGKDRDDIFYIDLMSST